MKLSRRADNAQWLIASTLLFALSNANVQAQQMPYYYGVNVGNGSYSLAGGGDPTFSAYLGKYLSENFTLEGGYVSLGEGGKPGASVTGSTLYGGSLLTLRNQQTPALSGFMTVGLSSWYFKTGSERDSGVDLYYGVGALYDLSKTLAWRVGYTRYVLNPRIAGNDLDEEVSVFSFGVQFRPE